MMKALTSIYKCGPVVTTLSDVASPNAERTSS